MTKSADAVSLATQASDLDTRVSAFEADRLCGGLVEIEAHLPDRADPNYVKVLCELIRVDMEYSWRDDSPRGIDDYLRDFPELIDHDESLESLTFEETRLRRQFAKTEVRQASVRSNDDEDASPGRADTEADSEDEQRVARMLDKLPRVGQEFAGFGLVAQLGIGAFGKVYLAKQRELSDRFVALKVSAEIFRESRMLAQLQHANIMPVYSVHQVDSVQAVCMPYLGSTTLADAIELLFRNGKTPRTGEELVSLIQHRMRLARAKHISRPLEPSEEYAEQVAYEELRRLTYVDAILTIALKLTAGLAHAHDRFILHRDIKPANVLLTDLGEPMLLDFNLSADVKNNAKALVKAMGGTLPYMSPEQLEAFRGGDAVADARSDQFSLGIVLYEVLTGKAPYPEPKTGGALLRLEIMVRDRRRGAPSLREKNPLVSPSVDAIVRKMLAPDPGKRYDSTHGLREDLIAQLENRPLLHAREPSLKERAKKWARRHPRLASARTVVSCVALLAIAITGSVLYVQHRESRREAARVALAWTQDQLEETQWLLHVHGSDRTKLHAASVACAAVLERYAVETDPKWREGPLIAELAPPNRNRLIEQMGEVLWFRAQTLLANGKPKEALEANRAAEACFPIAPASLWRQRGEILVADQREDEARAWFARADATVAGAARDGYLEAASLAGADRHADAIALLERSLRSDSRYFWSWFLLGVCHDRLGDGPRAIECYTACVAVRSDFAWAYFNRGLARLRQREHALAIADFGTTLEHRPGALDARLHRAVAYQETGKAAEAMADLDAALDGGADTCRVRFFRATLLDAQGQSKNAEAERNAGMALEPRDEADWVARGLARMRTDVCSALSDFEEALALNPRSLVALQNKAHALATFPDGVAQARATLDTALAIYPNYLPARSGRAVLRARLGDRAGAHADAEIALSQDLSPATLYQIACVYALMSKHEPGDRAEALRLLSSALRRGYGFDLIDRDADLDPLRGLPEFARVVASARATIASMEKRHD